MLQIEFSGVKSRIFRAIRLDTHDNGAWMKAESACTALMTSSFNIDAFRKSYEENRGCGENEQNFVLRLRADQVFGVDLALLQAQKSNKLPRRHVVQQATIGMSC